MGQLDERMERIFEAWEEWDMELEKERKVQLQKEFHALVEGFIQEERLPWDKWEFIRKVGTHYRMWRRRAH